MKTAPLNSLAPIETKAGVHFGLAKESTTRGDFVSTLLILLKYYYVVVKVCLWLCVEDVRHS